MNIKDKQKLNAVISLSKDVEYNLIVHSALLKRIANLEQLEIGKNLPKPDNSACEVLGQIQAFVPLAGIIDTKAEKDRQQKNLKQLEDRLLIVKRKLDNKDFVSRAAANIVAMEQNREKELLEQIEKVKLILKDIG